MFKSLINKKWTLFTSIIYVLPIIIANVFYTDDMGRAIFGYGWNSDGRIFATILMQILSFNEKIASLFPVSIMLSAIIMGASGIIVSDILFDKNKNWKILSSLFLITSPFYLENLSYRYDSIPMSISVLLSVIPFLFWEKRIFFIISVACLVLTLGFYQTSAIAYFSMLACLVLKRYFDRKSINIKLVCLCILSFIMSYIVYGLLIKYLNINLDRAGFLPLNVNSIDIIISRISIYTGVYNDLFNSGYIFAIIPLLLLFIISSAIISFKCRAVGFITVLIIIATFISLVFLTTLPNIFLKNPWFNARTFICYPFILYFLVLVCSRIDLPKMDALLSLSLGAVITYSFVIASVYGSVLYTNNEYDNFLSSSISSRMMSDNNYQIYKVVISGRSQLPLKSKLQYESYPILKSLAPIYNTENWYWGVRNLSRYIPMQSLPNNKEIISDICNYKIISRTSIYTIRARDNVYIIDFKRNMC